jgi:hypothetical protein
MLRLKVAEIKAERATTPDAIDRKKNCVWPMYQRRLSRQEATGKNPPDVDTQTL